MRERECAVRRARRSSSFVCVEAMRASWDLKADVILGGCARI